MPRVLPVSHANLVMMSGNAFGVPGLRRVSNCVPNCRIEGKRENHVHPSLQTAAGSGFPRPMRNCHWRAILRGTIQLAYKERPRGRSRLRRWSASGQQGLATIPCGLAFPGPRTGQPGIPSFRASGPANTDECGWYAVGGNKNVGGIVAVEIAFKITDDVVRAVLAGDFQVIARILASDAEFRQVPRYGVAERNAAKGGCGEFPVLVERKIFSKSTKPPGVNSVPPMRNESGDSFGFSVSCITVAFTGIGTVRMDASATCGVPDVLFSSCCSRV